MARESVESKSKASVEGGSVVERLSGMCQALDLVSSTATRYKARQGNIQNRGGAGGVAQLAVSCFASIPVLHKPGGVYLPSQHASQFDTNLVVHTRNPSMHSSSAQALWCKPAIPALRMQR